MLTRASKRIRGVIRLGGTSSPSNSTKERSLARSAGLPEDIIATCGRICMTCSIWARVSWQQRRSQARSAGQPDAIASTAFGPNSMPLARPNRQSSSLAVSTQACRGQGFEYVNHIVCPLIKNVIATRARKEITLKANLSAPVCKHLDAEVCEGTRADLVFSVSMCCSDAMAALAMSSTTMSPWMLSTLSAVSALTTWGRYTHSQSRTGAADCGWNARFMFCALLHHHHHHEQLRQASHVWIAGTNASASTVKSSLEAAVLFAIHLTSMGSREKKQKKAMWSSVIKRNTIRLEHFLESCGQLP